MHLCARASVLKHVLNASVCLHLSSGLLSIDLCLPSSFSTCLSISVSLLVYQSLLLLVTSSSNLTFPTCSSSLSGHPASSFILFHLVTGRVYHFIAKKSHRPLIPGLHSLLTLDAVQPGSLLPAPSVSKLKACKKAHAAILIYWYIYCIPYYHTHEIYMNLCFELVFSRLLFLLYLQPRRNAKDIKELRSVESGHSRWFFHYWSVQHAVLATNAKLTPAMAMFFEFRVGHAKVSKHTIPMWSLYIMWLCASNLQTVPGIAAIAESTSTSWN